MSKRVIEFLRRNLLVILLSILIIGQLLTWRTMVSLRDNYDWYACGTYSHPCRTVIVPESR